MCSLFSQPPVRKTLTARRVVCLTKPATAAARIRPLGYRSRPSLIERALQCPEVGRSKCSHTHYISFGQAQDAGAHARRDLVVIASPGVEIWSVLSHAVFEGGGEGLKVDLKCVTAANSILQIARNGPIVRIHDKRVGISTLESDLV